MEKSERRENEEPSTNQSENATMQSTRKLQDLIQLLYCPEPKVNQVESGVEASLSHVPWIIQWDDQNSVDTYVPLGSSSQSAATPDTQPAPSASFLPVSYLELRRQQNVAFADKKAVEAADAGLLDHAQAETLYRQALDLVPDHVPSLLGYAKLLYKTGRLRQAQRTLGDVLELEPDNTTALQYNTSLERTFRQQENQARLGGRGASAVAAGSLLSSGKKRKDLQMRESSAFQDALLERNLAMDGAMDGLGDFVEEGDGGAQPKRDKHNDSDSCDSDKEDQLRRKRHRHKKDQKRKKKKKRHKKERRRRHNSTLSPSSKASSAS
jgi:tetratricopeptide (TPR) repeat protein